MGCCWAPSVISTVLKILRALGLHFRERLVTGAGAQLLGDFTLDIMDPPPNDLPPKLRKRLRRLREELLEAWESVREVPPGRSPGVWEG